MLSSTSESTLSAESVEEKKSETIEHPTQVTSDGTFVYVNGEVAVHAELYKKGIIYLNKPTDSMERAAAKVTPHSFHIGNEVFLINTRQELEAKLQGSDQELLSSSDELFEKIQSVALVQESHWSQLIEDLTTTYLVIEKNCAAYYNSMMGDDDSGSEDDGFYQRDSSYQTVRSILKIINDFVGYLENLHFVYRMPRSYQNFTTASSLAKAFPKAVLSPLSPYIPSYKKTRALVFRPLIMVDDTSENIALRVFPSIFKKNDERMEYSTMPFDKFFFTAGMFGAGLIGITTKGTRLPVLNLNLTLPFGEEIVDIECVEPNFFEEFQRQTLKKFGLMMKKIGSQTATAICHLHSTEYAIHGFNLYFSKKMSLNALEKLVEQVERRQYVIVEQLTSLFETLGIELSIFSSLENLITKVHKDAPGGKIMTILRKLKLDALVPHPSNINQVKIIQHCLNALLRNVIAIDHAKIWNDFQDTMQGHLKNILLLEQFLQIAKVVAFAIAAVGMHSYGLCYIQLCSETGIQEIADFYFKHTLLVYRPSVLLNVLDLSILRETDQPVEKNEDGTAFHFQDSRDKKSAYMLITDRAFFQGSLKNAASQVAVSVEDVLQVRPG